MSNLNDIINQVSQLTGYVLDPVTLSISSSSAPSGTISTVGIYPGSVIKAEQVLNIINALNGTTTDFVIVSGSFALPSITGSQSLIVSGGIVYGTQTVQSASYALTASYASNFPTQSVSSSFAITSSLPLQGIITASIAASTITFTKGDNTTFDIVVSQSGSVESASYAVFAQTAGNVNLLDQNVFITGTLSVDGDIRITNIGGFYGTNFYGTNFYGTSSQAVSASYAETSSYNIYSITSSFALTSSLLTYEGTTARVSSNLNSIFLIQSGSNTVLNIDSTGNLTTSGSISLVTTGSFSNLLLIKNNNINYVRVNGEGVLQLNEYATPPTAVTGGLYFDNVGNFYVGI